jgi:hypothetical protein
VIVNIYKTGGHISRSVRAATLIAEVDVEPHEVPFDLTRFAKQHGGDFAEIDHPDILLEELQPV